MQAIYLTHYSHYVRATKKHTKEYVSYSSIKEAAKEISTILGDGKIRFYDKDDERIQKKFSSSELKKYLKQQFQGRFLYKHRKYPVLRAQVQNGEKEWTFQYHYGSAGTVDSKGIGSSHVHTYTYIIVREFFIKSSKAVTFSKPFYIYEVEDKKMNETITVDSVTKVLKIIANADDVDELDEDTRENISIGLSTCNYWSGEDDEWEVSRQLYTPK